MKVYVGLNSKQINESRDKYGFNEIKKENKKSLLNRIIDIFKEPMLLLLLVTSFIYFLLGEILDGIIMVVSVCFMCGIEFFQNLRTDKAVEVLNKLSSLNVKVIRNNREEVINSRDVVVGDLVLLEEGDKVVADGKILDCSSLGIDESALTGESQIVYKSLTENNEHFKNNMCYAGTSVTNGSAIIEITNVGVNTYYGKIGKDLDNIIKEKTPLEKQIKKLVLYCSFFSMFFCIAVVIANYFTSNGILSSSILAGITIAMATIPEEIPVILTVFLAMGASTLADKHTLTRNMKVVETLGAITVLCTDKTGTLTQNKMIVKEQYALNDDFIKTSILSCQREPYDPMEIAIHKYCFDKGTSENILKSNLIHEYIFNNEDKMMGNIFELDNKMILNVKGAFESIVPLCDLSEKQMDDFKEKINCYSKKGYRILAVANTVVNDIKDSLKEYKLHLCGLLALFDSPRDGVKESIKICHEAGVRVIMITGDNGKTAMGIASQIGLEHNNEVITGEELERMTDTELKSVVSNTNIFARVYPNHKMRIVSALQANKEVVAMTGDGINDAPALKKAEIGIAMGKRGTNVAKEASDMILMDDNFNTIVESIKNGRTIYNNIIKAISYVFVIHIPIAFGSLLMPLLKIPVFLRPIHIVLLELIIDPTSSIVFQRIKSDANVMKHRPRKIKTPLISKTTFIRSTLEGLLLFVASSGSYIFLLNNYYSQEFATSFAFSVLLIGSILSVYVLQSTKLMIKNFIDDFKDDFIVIINGLIMIILLLILYVPFLNGLVGTCFLNYKQLFYAFIVALLVTVPFDIIKLIKRIKEL